MHIPSSFFNLGRGSYPSLLYPDNPPDDAQSMILALAPDTLTNKAAISKHLSEAEDMTISFILVAILNMLRVECFLIISQHIVY